MARIAVKFILTLLVASTHVSGRITSFSYGVSDPNTGDFKDQHEKHEGGNVIGQYSLIDADGTKRVVDYTADAEGFKAVVHKEPIGISPLGTGGYGFGDPANGILVGPSYNGGGAEGAYLGHHAHPQGATPLNHEHPYGAAGSLTHGAHNGLPFANGPGNLVLAHGPHGYGLTHALPGNLPGSSVGGYRRRPAPAISHYSHTIVHDVRPYGGPYSGHQAGYSSYGRYGAQAPLAQEVPAQGSLPAPNAQGPLAGPLPNHGLITHPGHGIFGLPAQGSYPERLPHGGYATPGQGGWTLPLPNNGLVPLLNQYPGSLSHGPIGSPLGHGGFPLPSPHGGLPLPLPQGGLPTPLAHGGLPSPLGPGGLPSPLGHGGLPLLRYGGIPLPIALDSLNHNGPQSPQTPGAPHNGSQSPFFNGALARGALPQSPLAQNPASPGPLKQAGAESPSERPKEARSLETGNLGPNNTGPAAW